MKAICLVLVLAAVAVVPGAGCYKVKNDAFCCTTPESCAAHGAAFPDGCDGTFVCDEASLTCVDPGNGGKCMTAEQCVGTPVTPFCVDGTCKQCMGTDGCDAKNPVCGADNICGTCSGEPDCAPYSDTPHCGGDGACVACRDSKDCTTTTKPVCDTTSSTCGGCTNDDQCDSSTCDKTTGECIAEARILYIATTGTTGGSCTKISPCSGFADAIPQITAQRDVIKVLPGAYLSEIVLSGKKVTIYGEGATAQPIVSGKDIVSITNNSDVTIDGLHVTMQGGFNNNGVKCNDSGSTMRLRRMRIDLNAGGGVSITGCSYSLVNNFIVENGSVNGSVGSLFGGVLLTQINGGTLHEFSFNTVSANSSKAGTNTGVDCTTLGSSLVLDNNIVYNNTVTSGGKQVAVTGCSWSYSDISDGVPGVGNITDEPMFINAGASNYHLQPGSPAIDAADPAATLSIDFDGDVRPAGKGRDIGADEAK